MLESIPIALSEKNKLDSHNNINNTSNNSLDPFLNHVLFNHAENENRDQSYWFKLRGNNINHFIDCATPLLGMVLRAKTQQHNDKDKIEHLYKQCCDEIKAIEIELTEANYEYPTIIAYRYILCTFVDEAVMSTPWGSVSSWAHKSLLVNFHNEAWGGEKTFMILERLEKEVDRYFDLLEFIFLCLCLGFEGRYKIMKLGQISYDKVLFNLYEKLRRAKNKEPEALTHAQINVINSHYFLNKMLTPTKLALCIFLVTFVIYSLYLWQTSELGNGIIEDLRRIL